MTPTGKPVSPQNPPAQSPPPPTPRPPDRPTPIEPTATAALRALYRISRLSPSALRDRLFPTRWRGLDPGAVRGFLTEVAAELATLQRELVIVYQENDRLKGALRDWQSLHSRPLRTRATAPTAHRAWPVNPTATARR